MDLKWKILCWRTNSPSLSIGKLSPANLEVKLMYYSTTQMHPNHHGVLFAQIGSKLSNYPTSLFSDHLWYILTLREFHLPHLPLLEKNLFPFQDFAPLFRWKASQSPKDRKPSETAWGWATAVPCMGILVVNRNRVQKHKEFWSTRRSGAPKRKEKTHIFLWGWSCKTRWIYIVPLVWPQGLPM